MVEFPPERGDIFALYDPDPETDGAKTYCRHGAFIQDADLFDHKAFDISVEGG